MEEKEEEEKRKKQKYQITAAIQGGEKWRKKLITKKIEQFCLLSSSSRSYVSSDLNGGKEEE